MKQLVQIFKTGEMKLIDVPIPEAPASSVLIKTSASLISVGTEKMLVEFSRANILKKLKSQPQRVKKVIQKIKTDGLVKTWEVVNRQLSDPVPLGYSNVGEVVELGRYASDFKIGDRVVSNGRHAEFVSVGKNLVAKIPDSVDNLSAAFTVVSSISLQGIRLLNPAIGENIAIIGMGLLGQLAAQILQASGCRVLGIDIRQDKIDLAKPFLNNGLVVSPGDSPVETALSFSKGHGVDGVLITAATQSNDPLTHASEMCRKRGKIVLVGVAGLTIDRSLFYEKELSFQVSCSYGPGRYDPVYEEKGVDYPYGFVRWTEKRNFEAVLSLMSMGRLNVKPLITHQFPFEKSLQAYQVILKENPLGVILNYQSDKKEFERVIVKKTRDKGPDLKRICVGFLGVGNYAKGILLPILQKSDVCLKTIASGSGLAAATAGKRFNFEEITSSYTEVFEDQEINTVFIVTRHNSHAALVSQALLQGKNVFVEKPLALNLEELGEIKHAFHEAENKKWNPRLMVGFNRRFSRFITAIKGKVIQRNDPMALIMTVNAGFLPSTHWTQDLEVGGGRIIGEGCHFIDLFRFLVGDPIREVYALTTQGHSGGDNDKMMMTLRFSDGSIGVINYLANGSKKYPKERLEVFNQGCVYVIDNYRTLRSYGSNLALKSAKQDKGQSKEIEEFFKVLKSGDPSPIPFEELIETSLASIAAVESAKTGKVIDLKLFSNSLR